MTNTTLPLTANYEIVFTNDGSPSLRDLKGANQESMHHSGGAYSETQLIYGENIRQGLIQFQQQRNGHLNDHNNNHTNSQQASRGHVANNANASAESALKSQTLVVGLGLGYIELLWSFECLNIFGQNLDSPIFSTLHLHSFESDPFLRNSFIDFFLNDSDTVLMPVYQQILEYFLKDSRYQNINADLVKKFLRISYLAQRLKFFAAIEPEFPISWRDLPNEKNNYAIICYDAFSSKTSPHLWEENFLQRFFQTLAAPISCVSTYACTGALKRSLKSNDFTLDLRHGFSGKRQCTFARKGF